MTRSKDASDRVLALGIRLGVAAAIVLGVAHLVNVFAFDADVSALDAEAENNAWAWAASVSTFTAGLMLVLLGFLRPHEARRHWLLASVLAFFSLDDIIALHERVGTGVREDVFGLPTGWGRVVWPAIFFPLLAATFMILWRLAAEASVRTRKVLRGGLVALVGAVALELASAPWYIAGRSAHSVPGAVEVAVEEGLELSGWVLIASALTALTLAEARRPAVYDSSRGVLLPNEEA